MASLSDVYRRGREKFDRGDLDGALVDFLSVASASGAVEAHIALAYTYLRLAQSDEARQSVIRVLEHLRADMRRNEDVRSLCATLGPLIPQLSGVPADLAAPFLRRCGAPVEAEPSEPPSPPPPPSPPSSPRDEPSSPVAPPKGSSEECIQHAKPEHERCLAAADDAGAIPEEASEETPGSSSDEHVPVVCVCAALRDGDNRMVHEWVGQQLCSGMQHVLVRDQRLLTEPQAAVARWMLEPWVAAGQLTLLPHSDEHTPTSSSVSNASHVAAGARWARQLGAESAEEVEVAEVAEVAWALLVGERAASAESDRRPPDASLQRQCLASMAASVCKPSQAKLGRPARGAWHPASPARESWRTHATCTPSLSHATVPAPPRRAGIEGRCV